MAGFKRLLGKTFLVNHDSTGSPKKNQRHASQYGDDIGGAEYNKLREGSPPETGTYPLHGNGKSQADIFETTARPPRPLSRMSSTSSRFGGQMGQQRDTDSTASRPASMASAAQHNRATSIAASQASNSEANKQPSAPDPVSYSNVDRPATGYSDAASTNSIQRSNAGDFQASKVPANPRLQRSGSFSSGYSDVVEREAPTFGTYPLHGNSKEPFPATPKAPKSTAYASLKEGEAPRVGTLPLHGNPRSDIQRVRSKAAKDKEERGRPESRPVSQYSQFSQNAISRSRSGARIPRRSHSGARYAAGEPTNRRPSSVSSGSRFGKEKESTVMDDPNTYTDLSEPKVSALEDTPERTVKPKLDTAVQSNDDQNAKTPIANEFSYKTWYSKTDGPDKEEPTKDNEAEKVAEKVDVNAVPPAMMPDPIPAEDLAFEKSTDEPSKPLEKPLEQPKPSEQPIKEVEQPAKEVEQPTKEVERPNTAEPSKPPEQPRHDSVLTDTSAGNLQSQKTNSSVGSENDLELINTTVTRDFVYVTSAPGIEAAEDTVIEVRNKRGSIRYSLGKTFIPGYEERNVRATKGDTETAKRRRSRQQSEPTARTLSLASNGSTDEKAKSTSTPISLTTTRNEKEKTDAQDTSRNASTASTPSRRRSLRTGLEKLFMPYLHDDDVPPLPTLPKTAPDETAPTHGKPTSPEPTNDSALPSSSPSSSSPIQNNQKSSAPASNIYSDYTTLPKVDESVMRRHTDRQNRISSGGSPTSPIGSGNVTPREQPEIRKGRQNVYTQPIAVKDSPDAPSLEGIVNLNNTVETHLDTKVAKAVVHETIRPVVHHVREEQVTRELHTHDVHHRIQPIIDVQVLPTKHYVPDGSGGYREVSADQLPGRASNARNSHNWVLAETVSRDNYDSDEADGNAKSLGQEGHAQGKRAVAKGPVKTFTARTFEGNEGDYKEWVGEDGVRRSETTWVHPPTLATGARDTGQTEPIHFGQARTEKAKGAQYDEDGLLMDMESKLSLDP